MRRRIPPPMIAFILMASVGFQPALATGRIEARLALSTDPKAPSPATIERAPLDELERFVPNAQDVVSTNRVRFLLRDPIPWTRRTPDEVASLTCDVDQAIDNDRSSTRGFTPSTRSMPI